MIRQVLSRSIAVRRIVFASMFALMHVIHGVKDNIVGQLNWVRAIGVIMSPLNARISMHIHLLRSKCRIRFAPFFRRSSLRIHDIPPQRVSRLGSHRIMIVFRNTNFTICTNDKGGIRQDMGRRLQNHCVECFKIVARLYQMRAHLTYHSFIVGCLHHKLLVRLVEGLRMCFHLEKACNCLGEWMVHIICDHNRNIFPRHITRSGVHCFDM